MDKKQKNVEDYGMETQGNEIQRVSKNKDINY